ncbi:C2H2 and C2HC zinc finger [Glarea lozoyensis ATCC 20868]|uniref:C2H2 and C2HC zinc finger n=1 Tax=Glarea lozoyensis (strain ATCC 20868 / MF5171) TaxID=1116229 RepID=S3D9T6_GLAL2|nr:C2H2 and C2HC zinc finger [Glarea lozoyensis ATCC 20868]EPE33879.1 C2H2 and C2HC zinc finger [Glarea lozoyensis ATCC 20868]
MANELLEPASIGISEPRPLPQGNVPDYEAEYVDTRVPSPSTQSALPRDDRTIIQNSYLIASWRDCRSGPYYILISNGRKPKAGPVGPTPPNMSALWLLPQAQSDPWSIRQMAFNQTTSIVDGFFEQEPLGLAAMFGGTAEDPLLSWVSEPLETWEATSKEPTNFTPQACEHLGCNETQKFTCRSALKRHMENKHLRRHKCTIENCNSKGFGNAGDLKRHQSTVHKQNSRKHICPHAACKRHRHGFVRKDNLSEHLRRVHRSQADNNAVYPNEQGDREVDDDYDEDLELRDEGCLSSVSTERPPNSQTSPDKSLLMAKLQELEDLEAKIEKTRAHVQGDIVALKRVLAIF